MARRITVITTSRADYSHLHWVLRDLRDHPGIDLRLVAIGAQLTDEFGRAVREIERDGIPVDEQVECLLSSDSDVGMAKTIGVAVLGLAELLHRRRPELLLLIADRYELLAPAAVALALRIPIAHIEGGEVSEGAIDDAVRNALTKMSHLHFTATAAARERVLALGEESWRVHHVGAPSLDHLHRSSLPSRATLEQRLGTAIDEGALLVAYHPVTLARDTLLEVDALLDALDRIPGQLLFCFPNADAGSRRLIQRVEAFCARRSGAKLFVNLGPLDYWGLLGCVGCMLGNSSSGIMETASIPLPTVNIGSRQQGRERAANVVDVPADGDSIVRAVQRARGHEFLAGLRGIVNPYGDGQAAGRIARVLAEVEADDRLLAKKALPVDRRWIDEG